jgi:hypothetical protein
LIRVIRSIRMNLPFWMPFAEYAVRSSLVALKPHEHTTAKGVLAEFRELARADEMTLESGEFLDNISHTRYKEIS